MLQGSNSLGHERPLIIRLSFTTCVLGAVCLPLLGLTTCVFISSVFHYEDSTGTHCQVPNYLPSISASIGQSPECYIWRFCIGLDSAPRLLVAFTYFKFYHGHLSLRFPGSFLCFLNLVFSFLENIGLLLLTYVSSNETYFVHKEGSVLFLVSSVIYMSITCWLWNIIKKYSLNPEEAKSYRWKVRLLTLKIVFCAFAVYFYWKHNAFCESGSYTFFALFEYLAVLSNMAFHLTAVWDFKCWEVMVISL